MWRCQLYKDLPLTPFHSSRPKLVSGTSSTDGYPFRLDTGTSSVGYWNRSQLRRDSLRNSLGVPSCMTLCTEVRYSWTPLTFPNTGSQRGSWVPDIVTKSEGLGISVYRVPPGLKLFIIQQKSVNKVSFSTRQTYRFINLCLWNYVECLHIGKREIFRWSW